MSRNPKEIVCEVFLGGERHLVTFDQEELDSIGEEIMAFYAWLDDSAMSITATLRGEHFDITEQAYPPLPADTEVDGPWLIADRETWVIW